MENLPKPFFDMLRGCTLLEKRAMLLELQNSIRSDERQASRDIQVSKLPDFVQYLPDFIPETDLDFLSNIIKELESIGSLKPASAVRSQWLSHHGEAYQFGGKAYESMDLSQFTHIETLMNMVNKSASTTHDANSCLINFYTDCSVAGRRHSDDEKFISQTSSICTVSIGSTRDITFTRFHDRSNVIEKFTLEHGSAFVMKPGCQKYIKHQLMQGKTGPGIRYSISFRRSIPTPESETPSVVQLPSGTLLLASPSPSSSESGSVLSKHEHTRTPPLTRPSTQLKDDLVWTEKTHQNNSKGVLVIGDSYAKRLVGSKIGKGKHKVFNKSMGGANIRKTELQLDSFFVSEESLSCEITHIFVSVCTNDIRYCYGRGIKHLKAPLQRLIAKIKYCFPLASIHMHSLLPILAENQFTEMNVLMMNDLIYDICKSEKLYYLDFFTKFLDEWTNDRLDYLFEDAVHPTSRAMGLIAKEYIFILHRNTFKFNPLAYY